jgi:citrate lyase subunit beta/citryl-CoA lyase
VAVVNTAWLPSAAELAWAQRVVAAAQAAPGAVQLDGRMIDKPVLAQAQALLARAAAPG